MHFTQTGKINKSQICLMYLSPQMTLKKRHSKISIDFQREAEKFKPKGY